MHPKMSWAADEGKQVCHPQSREAYCRTNARLKAQSGRGLSRGRASKISASQAAHTPGSTKVSKEHGDIQRTSMLAGRGAHT